MRYVPGLGRSDQFSSIEYSGHIGIRQGRLCEAVCSSIVSDGVREFRVCTSMSRNLVYNEKELICLYDDRCMNS